VSDAEGFAEIARSLAHAVEAEGNVRAVFGAPMKLDTHTIVPVATVKVGGGGGGVRSLGAAVSALRELVRWRRSTEVAPSRSFAGGGGMGIDVRPIGYLVEEDGRVTFKPIDAERRAH
jgi:uncharacterized spore protein YtfJ